MTHGRRSALAVALVMLGATTAACTSESPAPAARKPAGKSAEPNSLDPKMLAMVKGVSVGAAGSMVNRTEADAAQRNGNSLGGMFTVGTTYGFFAVCAGKGAVLARVRDGKHELHFTVPCRTDKVIGEVRQFTAKETTLWTESEPQPGATGVVALQVSRL